MNDKTLQLLEKLAMQFGTTADKLWQIAVKQAPIDSVATTISLLILGVTLTVVTLRVRRRLNEPVWPLFQDVKPVPVVLLCICWAGFLISLFALLPGLLAGFYNPEAWVLMRLKLL